MGDADLKSSLRIEKHANGWHVTDDRNDFGAMTKNKARDFLEHLLELRTSFLREPDMLNLDFTKFPASPEPSRK